MELVKTVWKRDMVFDSEVHGHHVITDSAPEFGGKNRGPRPKAMVLTALGGCTGMDVVSILNKMRVSPDQLRVTARAEESEDHPKVYTSIHLTYEFKGKDLPMDKLKKAVDLSQERYCGVSTMLRKACTLTYEIKILE
jgi:putative redox protein